MERVWNDLNSRIIFHPAFLELQTRTTSAPFYVGAALPDDDMIVKVFHCTNVNNVFDL